jgi:hypothetical protein
MVRCLRRAARLAVPALAVLGVLSSLPAASAWTFDPNNPTNLPIVGQVSDPNNPTDPDPIYVPLPTGTPDLHDLIEYKLENVNSCVAFACVYVDAVVLGSHACGGFLATGATIILQGVNGPYVEIGHEAGVYGGYAGGCTDHSHGLTIDP